MKLAIDTNILAYAEGLNGEGMKGLALAAIAAVRGEDVLIPVQVASELYSVLIRKGGWRPSAAREAIARLTAIWPTVATDQETLTAAIDLVVAHRIAFWDAIVLASAAEAGCDILLSEDFQAGFTWRGVTVRNPLAPAA